MGSGVLGLSGPGMWAQYWSSWVLERRLGCWDAWAWLSHGMMGLLDQGSNPCLLLGRRILYHWTTGEVAGHFYDAFDMKLLCITRIITLVFEKCCCSATQSCPALCDPMDWSPSGLSVPHHLPKFAQVHVHNAGDLRNVVGQNDLNFIFAQFISDLEVEGRFPTKSSNLYFLILSKWEDSLCLLVFFFSLLRKLFTRESTTYFGWSLLEYSPLIYLNSITSIYSSIINSICLGGWIKQKSVLETCRNVLHLAVFTLSSWSFDHGCF